MIEKHPKDLLPMTVARVAKEREGERETRYATTIARVSLSFSLSPFAFSRDHRAFPSLALTLTCSH